MTRTPQDVLIFRAMERESYLRSLPYLHLSTWPAPSAARAYGGAYVRKLIFSGHVVSIEPSGSISTNVLGPAFFLADDDVVSMAATDTDGGSPSIDNDPALCPFEASVLVPKSIAGVSPGASSASTAFASSQSPVGTTPASAAGKATPAATAATLAGGRLSDTPKQTDATPAPEPVLYFRFGCNGTYCVNFSCIHGITVEAGINKNSAAANDQTAEAENSQGSDKRSQALSISVPPSVVISFDTCSFRIFQLATSASANRKSSKEEDTRDDKLKALRLIVNELTASLRAAGSFVPPPSPSVDRESSGDTQTSDRPSLDEGGQLDGGIGLESSSGTCSEAKGQSQTKNSETGTLQMSGDVKDELQPSQQSLTTAEGDTQRRTSVAKEQDEDSQTARETQSKRRRIAYNQSIAAIESIGAIVDPLHGAVASSAQRRLGSVAAQKQLSSLMTAAATALATSYEEGGAGLPLQDDRVDRITACLDDTVSEFIPIHTRVKHQRGGVLSSLSMSSPPPTKKPSLEAKASAAAGPTGDDDSARDADELRNVARQMMDEYRGAVAAKHRSVIFPGRR